MDSFLILLLFDNFTAKTRESTVDNNPPTNILNETSPAKPGRKYPTTAEPNTIFAISLKNQKLFSSP